MTKIHKVCGTAMSFKESMGARSIYRCPVCNHDVCCDEMEGVKE